MNKCLVGLGLAFVATSLGCAPSDEGAAVDSASSESRAYTSNPGIIKARESSAALKKALAKDGVFDTRLGVELATLRPLLTDAEVTAYQQKYAELDPVLRAERDVADAAFALRTALDAIMVDPTEVMRGAHVRTLTGKATTVQQLVTYGPKQVYESYRQLAGTSEGDAAAAFADRLLRHEPALKAVWSKHDDATIMDELGRPGLLKALVRALASVDASTAANPVDEVRARIGAGSTALSAALNTMTLLGDHEVDELAKELGTKTIPLGVAMAVWQLGRDANNAHWQKVLKDLLALPGATAGTLEFAEALHVVSASSRLFVAGKAIGKFAGGLGALVQTITLLASTGEWNKSPGTKVAIVGNAVGALGSILALCGVASAGPIGSLVALAATLIGPLMDKAREDGRQNKDKEAVLTAIGWPSAHARNVARARGDFIRALTGPLGMDRTASLQLLDLIPEIAHGDFTDLGLQARNLPLALDGLVTFQAMFRGTSARTLVDMAMGSETDPQRRARRLEAVIAITDCRKNGYEPLFTTAMTTAEYKSQFAIMVPFFRSAAGSDGKPALDAIAPWVAALP